MKVMTVLGSHRLQGNSQKALEACQAGIREGGADARDSGAKNAIATFKDIANYVGFTLVGIVHGSTPEASGPDVSLLESANHLGKNSAISDLWIYTY